MGFRCDKCDEYRVFTDKCRCKVIGVVWFPDDGETEEDGQEIRSIHDPEIALGVWAERYDGDCGGEVFNYGKTDHTVAFRPAGSDEIENYVLSAEPTIEYSARRA